jgi:hypothetical protein
MMKIMKPMKLRRKNNVEWHCCESNFPTSIKLGEGSGFRSRSTSKGIFGSGFLKNALHNLLLSKAGSHSKLWIEETKELDVFETEISWNLKGLFAKAIATAVRKKSLAAVAPAIWFSETPPRRERALDRCSWIETPPPTAVATFTTTTIL